MGSPEFNNGPVDRLIEHALRERHDELPEDFAGRTAAFVESAVRRGSDRVESWLQRALIATLIFAAVVTLLVVGGTALATLTSSAGAGWIYAGALCLGLSLVAQRFAMGKQASS
jgi:hypothetical protein